MEGYINRAFKNTDSNGKVKYEIRNAGVEAKAILTEDFEDAVFEVTTGDYSNLMKLVVENLEEAEVKKLFFQSCRLFLQLEIFFL